MAPEAFSVRELGLKLLQQIYHQPRSKVPWPKAIHPINHIDVEVLAPTLLSEIQRPNDVTLFVQKVKVMRLEVGVVIGLRRTFELLQRQLPIPNRQHRLKARGRSG